MLIKPKKEIPNYVEEDVLSSKILGDLVEKALLKVGDLEVARKFILYRSKAHCDEEIVDKKFDVYLIKHNGKKQKFKLSKITDLYSPDSYLDLFNIYLKEGLYYKYFKKFYTDQDILEAGKKIVPERDFDYGYTTILMYNKRYLLNSNKVVRDLPQQMYMSAALFLEFCLEKIKNGLKKILNMLMIG